jgi:peroxiredoxin/predicted kinase
MAQKLYVMVGLPGSGKTTYARSRLRGAARVSMDDLRLMLHGAQYDARYESFIHTAARDLLDRLAARANLDRFDVLFDATNVTRAYRAECVRRARRFGLEPVCVYCEVDLETALMRNGARASAVPADIVRRFQGQLEPPAEDEGFGSILRVVRTSEEEPLALDVGQPAPDFTLDAHDGSQVSLSSFKGKKNVVVFFFPKAFTGTCERQVTGHGQDLSKFADLDAEVLGISTDQSPSQAAFAKACGNVSFKLLSDHRHKTVNAYGVARAEGALSNERAAFVIDKQGIVRYKQVEPKPGDWAGTAGELEALGKLR